MSKITSFFSFFKKINFTVAYSLLSIIIVIGGTLIAIAYAKGNFRFTQSGFINETGLLSANSYPNGAQVYLNNKLVTATDDTLYLEPDKYEIKIIKDGYAPWEKTITVEKELVAQTNAVLFPNAPSLTPLTFTGAENVSPSPDGQKLIYYTASASAQAQNGLYVLELSANFFPLQKSARQIANDVTDWDLAQAKFIWSPDSNEVMLIAYDNHVLLSLDKKQNLLSLPDVSLRKKQIFSQWEEEMYLRERQFLAKFPPEIIKYATTSARNVYLSPDKKKLLYTAQINTTLPDNIIPQLPATNTQSQERALESNGVYIYDSQEDKNFRIGTELNDTALNVASDLGNQTMTTQKQLLAKDLFNKQPLSLAASSSAFTNLQASSSAETAQLFKTYFASLYANSYQWFPDSRHIIHSFKNNLKIMEYDGSNDTTIYSGPFAENFTYTWPDGSKLIILTAFSPNSPLNLYAVELKR